jgi:hypothetical protein
MDVGSSSKMVATSCPCGTDTRQYTGIETPPLNLLRMLSVLGSLSI